jgi:N utilization substance protein B
MTEPSKNIKKAHNTPRHSSRVASVQALYQIEQTNENVKSVITDMIESNFSSLEMEGYTKPDTFFFEDLVKNTHLLQNELDKTIEQFLANNWRLDRLASIIRSILRLATYELKNCLTVPTTVVLNEYIEITKVFFDNKGEHAFVNGILDKISQEVRNEKHH